MDTRPDTIRINAFQREEIQATHADLFVSVKGSSLHSGDAALKKAREVRQLVEELGQVGLPAEAIHLQSVYSETASGALLRSSSATYRLRLRCEKLEIFADLLGVIASQKNATFEHVEWKYPDEIARETALEAAITKADAKAHKIAARLGVKLLGIYTFTENSSSQESPVPQPVARAPQATPRGMGIVAQPPDLGMNIQHSKMIEVKVDVEYRISGFENEA